jgi:tRNA (guanosine-2'-O-)-methyltransferase
MKPLIGTDLKRFLRNYRRRYRPDSELAVLLQSVEYPVNVGSIFRLADAAGISELVLTGITPRPPNATIQKVGRGKSANVPWRYEKDSTAAISQLHSTGYHIVAMELTEQSVPYHRYQYPLKTCFVLGHEDHGVTKSTLALCDAAVFVPMYGKGRSHNVSTALAIVLYHALHAGEQADADGISA